MNIVEALKIKPAAKAYLGLLAIAAQVALDYMPDHNTGWYTATQVVLGALGVIGIFAVPNRVAEAKDAADDVAAEVKQILPTIVLNTKDVDPARVAAAVSQQFAQVTTAPVTPVQPAPVTDTPAPATDPAGAAPAPVATPIQKDTPAP